MFEKKQSDTHLEARQLRILFVSHTLPYPENTGSKIRIANLLRGVCAIADVHFVGYVDEGTPEDEDNAEGIRLLQEVCPNSTVLERGPYWWPPLDQHSVKDSLCRLVAGQSSVVFREFQCASLVEKVREMAHDFDLIWVERLWIAHHLRELGQKIIVDLDDLESVKIRRRLAGRKPTLANLSARYDGWKASRTERQAANDFLRLVVCSDGDRELWPKNKERVWVVPNGFNDSLLELPLPEVSVKRAIFVGTLIYWPNVTAAQFFAKHVMPILTQRFPDFEFWIVGKSPLPEVIALDNGCNVRVFPDVPDVIDYVRQAMVSIVSLRVGGGTRLKILESIAAGVPVVSTDIGIEGIELEPELHYLAANTEQEMAAAVIRLVENPALAQTQVNSARKVIAEKYSWTGIQQLLGKKLRALALK